MPLLPNLGKSWKKKDYETAKQYLRVEDYKAAIGAFDNFITDHPGSTFRKDAFYGRFEAAYKLAIHSIPSLVQERLITAKGYYNNFMKYYKDTDLAPAATEMFQDIESRVVTLKTEPTT